jgi:hypothetical protein
MTSPIREMNCDQFADTLADFLEREVPEGTRAAMESHALGCVDCGPLLADLRKLRVDAANLSELTPSRDLWAGVAERIETPVVSIGQRARGPVGLPRSVWFGLAAAGLVAITATVTHQVTKRTLVVPAPTQVAVAPAATPIATLSSPKTDSTPVSRPTGPQASRPAGQLVSNKPTAEQTYSTEISRLHKILDGRKNYLDSATVAVLEKNLKIIDNAIAQCRLALQKDPASTYLNESLNDALDNKVQLLRAAAGMPTRM